MRDSIFIVIRPEEIEEAKRKQNKVHAESGSLFESETAWVGYLGEKKFPKALLVMGIDPKTEVEELGRPNQKDFRVLGTLVEIKTAHQNGKTQPYYSCKVPEEKMNRYLSGERPEVFFFAAFVANMKAVEYYGWITFDDFKKRAIYYPKGYQEGGFTAKYPYFAVTAGILNAPQTFHVEQPPPEGCSMKRFVEQAP